MLNQRTPLLKPSDVFMKTINEEMSRYTKNVYSIFYTVKILYRCMGYGV